MHKEIRHIILHHMCTKPKEANGLISEPLQESTTNMQQLQYICNWSLIQGPA